MRSLLAALLAIGVLVGFDGLAILTVEGSQTSKPPRSTPLLVGAKASGSRVPHSARAAALRFAKLLGQLPRSRDQLAGLLVPSLRMRLQAQLRHGSARLLPAGSELRAMHIDSRAGRAIRARFFFALPRSGALVILTALFARRPGGWIATAMPGG